MGDEVSRLRGPGWLRPSTPALRLACGDVRRVRSENINLIIDAERGKRREQIAFVKRDARRDAVPLGVLLGDRERRA